MRVNKVVPCTSSMTFDGNQAQSFETTLTSSVSSVSLINLTAGELYSISVTQDATGGRSFPLPALVINPISIDTDPNSTTVQLFVCRSNGNLYPTTQGQYN